MGSHLSTRLCIFPGTDWEVTYSTKPQQPVYSMSPLFFSTLTCELQLAQPVVNQCCVLRTSPSLLPLVFASDLMNQPAQRSWTMQAVANQIPGQRADQIQTG